MLSCDSDTDIEDEFFTALALFKSTSKSSEIKLREMLITSIVRRNKFSNHDIKIPLPTSEHENPSEPPKKINPQLEKQLENIESEENSGESIEIPRISIPDEEFIDLTTCKICDGDKIGPFILLECQDCLDTYHPLCHQPPVIDIDVYDPRLVWRCGKCKDIYQNISPSKVAPSNSPNKSNDHENNNQKTIELINKNIPANSSAKIFLSKNNERELTKEIIKDEYLSLGNPFRKRIGSKLTVSRVNLKL